MSRLAIIGCEASGKTVLVSSIVDYFKAGVPDRSCCIAPDNIEAHRFLEYTNYQMRVRHEWPQATSPDRVQALNWSLLVDGSAVSNLEMLDFGGEVFRTAFRNGAVPETSSPAARDLIQYLSKADFIVITVSLTDLVRGLDGELSDSEFEAESESKWVTQGLLGFIRTQLPPETGVVVALTKADLHRDVLAAHGGAKNLFLECWPTILMLYPDVPVVAVASVSAVSNEDGTPVDGYTTEGILPVMKVFADYCAGGLDLLRSVILGTMDGLRHPVEDMDPLAFRQLIQDYEDQVELFGVASGLTGDAHRKELIGYVNEMVDSGDALAVKLRALESAAAKKWREQEERRIQVAEAAEQKRIDQERETAERKAKRREEDLRRAMDDRVRAESELERQRLVTMSAVARAQAEERRVRARILALVLFVVVFIVGAGVFLAYGYLMAQRLSNQVRLQELRQQEASGHLEREPAK